MDTIRSRCNTIFELKINRLFAAMLVSAILVVALTGAAISKYSIVIEDEATQTIVFTSENQPEKILEQESILLSPHDNFTFSGLVDNKGTITVNRAKEVTMNADGKTQTLHIVGGTVADALQKASITVNDEDFINVSLTEPINSDMNISINRVTYNTVTQVKQVPFEVTSFSTQTLKKGKTRTLSPGTNGEYTTVTEQKLLDGVVVEEKIVSEALTKKPVTAKVLVGDPNAPTSQLIPNEPIELDANGNPVSYKSKHTGKATAYSSLGRRTKLVPGAVAMNLNNFPRGTKVYIKTPNGSFVYGYSEVRDTGTALVNNTILVDLFFSSYKESCLFGAKTVDIYVL
ncbi:MAG: G5 domain-containing protein [Oscillospiraceae bacterium]